MLLILKIRWILLLFQMLRMLLMLQILIWDHPYITSANYWPFWTPPTHFISINTLLNVSKSSHFLYPPTQSFCWHNIRMLPMLSWEVGFASFPSGRFTKYSKVLFQNFLILLSNENSMVQTIYVLSRPKLNLGGTLTVALNLLFYL